MKYQDLALRCFSDAREHCLYQPCQKQQDCLSQIAHVKVDMLTLDTIGYFCDTQPVYQRLSECVVTQCQVTEAQDMMTSITPQITHLTPGWRTVLNEDMLICDVILNIRLTQLYISYNKFVQFDGYTPT